MEQLQQDSEFANDVLNGFLANHKYLPSKYFYDTQGSVLFQRIMAMPEYYPTKCEMEILQTKSAEIFHHLNFAAAFDIIEFGAGDGSKTISLLKTFSEINTDVFYKPVDISHDVLETLADNLKVQLPKLKFRLIEGDYSTNNNTVEERPALLLFLGGNIGNYNRPDAIALLHSFAQRMKTGDKLLIGFDLRKDPNVIKVAYDDPHGITEAFNMNLLKRINDELEADINLEKFGFYCHYDPVSGGVHSYLFSREKQEVTIKTLNKKFSFRQNELIFTELSQKFNFAEIESLAIETGFSVLTHVTDSRNYFTDSLWVKQ